MPLKINNIIGNTYYSCFQRIKYNAENQNNKILYGLSSWNSLNISDNKMSISLLAWNRNNSVNNKVSLNIDCEKWSQLTKNSFIKELNEANEAAKLSYQRKNKMRTWIFFIGTQDLDNINFFHTANRKLISIIHTSF